MAETGAPVCPPRVGQALRQGVLVLSAAGVHSPRADAEALLAHVLQVSRPEVVRRALLGRELTERDHTAYTGLLAERADRVPLQHLTGLAYFAGLDLAVGPGVFVPRPETEVLVGLAVHALAVTAAPLVLDLCTGSGAVALALKHRVPHARVVAVELSELAVAWAGHNISRTGLDVELRQGPAQEAGEDLRSRVDLVTCNPPYIPVGAVPLDPEVRDHDPEVALYGGGADGLAVPLQIAVRAAELLRPGGVLLMEHAEDQRAALTGALARAGVWGEVTDHDDLTGRPRVTRAKRAH